jgi:transcriptional regulator with XRE-family HTH domain
MPKTIGTSLRAARERRGWTREALAYHAGVSWAAIAQIESGRRSDARLSTLSALARALEVSLDHLAGATVPATLLEHQALVYGSDEEFLETAVPFLSEGVERSERPLAVTTQPRIRLLRKALGKQGRHVELADSGPWLSSPTAALGRFRAYLTNSLEGGALWIRILGEPVWSERSAAQVREWTRFESLLNLSFAFSPVTIVCPYDTRTAPRGVIAGAHRTHPELAGPGGPVASSRYREPESFLIGVNPR